MIVNWNAGAALIDCLASIHHAPPRDPWEVVVVDNASRDGSLDDVPTVFPSVRLVRNRSNRGLAAANNQGIVATAGELLLIANPDVRFEPGAIDALVDVLDHHPEAAISVPRLHYEDGTLQTSAGDLPTLREALAGRQRQRRARADTGFWWDGWPHDEERNVGRGHEAAYLVRRDAIVEVGPQDERFVLDWEGIDWTARLRAAGWQVWFTPAAVVVHLGGVSIRQAPIRWVLRSHLGMFRYFVKRRPAWAPWLAPLIAARAAIKVAAALRSDVYERGHRADA